MTWTSKERPGPFEHTPIEGLHFLDGDLAARKSGDERTKGHKYPMVAFPSGATCVLWESRNPRQVGNVHLFGVMDLPLRASRTEAFEKAQAIGERNDYQVERVGHDSLEVWGKSEDEHFLVTYDHKTNLIADVVRVEEEQGRLPLSPEQPSTSEEASADVPEPGGTQAPSPLADPEAWHELEAAILTHWQRLPPEMQAAVLVEQLRAVLDGEWGELVRLELARDRQGGDPETAYLVTGVSRADLTGDDSSLAERGEQWRDDDGDVEWTSMAAEDRQTEPVTDPERLHRLKDELTARWEQLPAEHQATMALVLLDGVMSDEWGEWMRDAIELKWPGKAEALPRQAAELAEQSRDVLGSQQGEDIRQAWGQDRDEQPVDRMFRITSVSRSDLQQVGFGEDDIDWLSDDDMETIARKLEDHYVDAMFWDDLRFVVEEVLERKGGEDD